MKFTLKVYLLLLFFGSYDLFGQSIIGSGTASVGSTSRYTITFQNPALVSWSLSGGGSITNTGMIPGLAEVSQNDSEESKIPIGEGSATYFADVSWTSSGTFSISVSGSTNTSKSVTVSGGGGPTPGSSVWTESNGEIYYTGNVGIGNTNPAYKLDVSANSRISGDLRANRFIDNNNSSYYTDPSSTSKLNAIDANYYDVNSGNGKGLRFWNSNNYKIHMGNSAEYKYGPVQDYSIKNNMSNTANRGWTWGVVGETPVAAINTQGVMQIKGNFTTESSVYANSISTQNYNTNSGNMSISAGGWGMNFKIDTDNNSTNHYQWFGNGTERMRLTDTGLLGVGVTDPSENLDLAGTARLRGVTKSNSQNKILAINSNGKVFWRDANTISGSIWGEDSGGAVYDGDVEASGSFETWGGDVAAYNGSIIGRNFVTESLNNNSVNIPMNIYTERGSIKFEIDSEVNGTTYNGFSWDKSGNRIMFLGEQGHLVIGGTPPPGNPWAQFELLTGTMRIRQIEQEPSQYDRILSVDETGKVFFKDATTITGSIDPSENIDFEGIITIGNPSISGSPTGQFYVNGPSYFTEINVEVGPWPDYVFLPDYKLRPLEEVYSFIKINGHLPEVPSADKVSKNGINVSEMNALLLKKIEELTLYQIELLDMLKNQQAEIDALKAGQN